ncbi:MAG: DUF4405 domain-containing protein [Eggerthellaceae bacterium]|nr:DUF4405 domain-containing protein [Eggerthellaceae bacterium]
MKGRNVVKAVLDIAMAAVLVAVMATALVQEAPHEWLGLAMLVLMAAHVVLNRKWLASVFRGRRSVLRVLQIVMVVALVACFAGQVASSLVISKHAFGFLPALPGSSWARRVHMLCSYWMFVLAFVHAGLHIRLPKRMASWQLWVVRVLAVLVACYGAVSFAQLGLLPYLTGQVQFAAADYAAPLALSFARYASVGVLFGGVSHCVRSAAELARKRKGRG